MMRRTLKRSLSEDNKPQTSVWVDQMMVSSVESPMPNLNTTTTTNASEATEAPTALLCDHYQLLGNGTIRLRNVHSGAATPNLERSKSRCCQRETLIHDTCANCTMDLCEECGYSCVECAQFICRFCVLLFGNGPQEAADDPLCERCQMFFT